MKPSPERRRIGWPNSLGSQLFIAIGLILLLSAASTLALGGLLTRRAVDRATLRDLSHQADLLANREAEDILPLARLADLEPYLKRQNERVVVLQSLESPSEVVSEQTLKMLRRGQAVDGSITIDGVSNFFAARAGSELGKRGFVLLRPHGNASADWYPFLDALAIAVIAAVLLTGVTSLLMARRISRPLRRVAQSSRTLAEKGVSEPLPLEGARELRSLAASFNEMAKQLAVAREAEKEFLLSVSHELKTPLAAVRGYAEALADGAIAPVSAAETIGREALRLERLVGDLLDLARVSRSEFSIRCSPLDLEEVAREAFDRYRSQAEAFGVRLDLSSSGPVEAVGDYDRLLQIVSNLIENALRVTPSGGSICVSLANVDGEAVLNVEDTGPGLDEAGLSHAFERFYLYAHYRGERPVGTGLGLAIVSELAAGMDGSVSVTSRPGAGASFSVRLPRASDMAVRSEPVDSAV